MDKIEVFLTHTMDVDKIRMVSRRAPKIFVELNLAFELDVDETVIGPFSVMSEGQISKFSPNMVDDYRGFFNHLQG